MSGHKTGGVYNSWLKIHILGDNLTSIYWMLITKKMVPGTGRQISEMRKAE